MGVLTADLFRCIAAITSWVEAKAARRGGDIPAPNDSKLGKRGSWRKHGISAALHRGEGDDPCREVGPPRFTDWAVIHSPQYYLSDWPCYLATLAPSSRSLLRVDDVPS